MGPTDSTRNIEFAPISPESFAPCQVEKTDGVTRTRLLGALSRSRRWRPASWLAVGRFVGRSTSLCSGVGGEVLEPDLVSTLEFITDRDEGRDFFLVQVAGSEIVGMHVGGDAGLVEHEMTDRVNTEVVRGVPDRIEGRCVTWVGAPRLLGLGELRLGRIAAARDGDERQNGDEYRGECSHHRIIASATDDQTITKRRMIVGATRSQSPPNMTTACVFRRST